MGMAAQYEMLTQLAKAGTKLDFGQDLFVKFYQAFIASNRWQQYLKGVIPTLYVTAIALTIGVVLGSEGSGVSQLVKKLCDGVVRLDMAAQGTGVDSFNVSVAAGIILYEIQSQRAAQG